MSVELFLTLLMVSTIITVALTEALKRLLNASDTPYRANIVALDSAMLSCTGLSTIYRIPFGLGFEIIQVIRLFFLILCTWHMAMFVYDKLRQTVQQYKKFKECKKEQARRKNK